VAEGVETVDFPEDDNEGDGGEGDEKMEPDNITLLNPGEEEVEGMEGMQVEGEETDQLQIDEGKMSAGLSHVFSSWGHSDFPGKVPLSQVFRSNRHKCYIFAFRSRMTENYEHACEILVTVFSQNKKNGQFEKLCKFLLKYFLCERGKFHLLSSGNYQLQSNFVIFATFSFLL
jgi:hypothetical protein